MTRMVRARRSLLFILLAGACAPLVAAAPAGATLPDGRAYEQVTPVDKNGGDVSFGFQSVETGVPVATDGNSVVWLTLTPSGDTPTGLLTQYFRATRGSAGWTSHSMSYPVPSDPNALDSEVANAFSPDLTAGIVTTDFPYDSGDSDADPGNFMPTGHYDQYLFGGPSPAWLSQGSQGGDGFFDSAFSDATPDLSHVIFQTPESLEPNATGLTGTGDYVYERSGGTTQLINVDNNGDLLDPAGATAGNGTVLFGGGGSANTAGITTNAVSDDGSKVFFESPVPNSGAANPPQLYMRDTAAGTTTLVSRPDQGVNDPNGTQQALYAGASSDGSKVFFTTTQQLTADDSNTTNDVYEYDTATDTLTRVSRGQSGTADAGVDGVVLVSDDGSQVYFVAEHQLVPNEGTDNQPNLYRYDTSSGDTAFVATLSPNDQQRLWDGNQVDTQAFTTNDGSVLAFTSTANLTSYDSQGHWEAYIYRAGAGTIECASCRPDGTPPTGDADFGPSPGFRNGFFNFGFPHPLTADGSRLFFETADSLLPGDANGTSPLINGSEDVYEYENGTVSLISDGHSSYGSTLEGVSQSGDDVFFYTRSALVPQDTDGGVLDAYDARVGGGFPPPPGSAPCDGGGCHGTPTEAPFLPIPTSASAPTGKTPVPPGFTVSPISRAAAERAARTGHIVLTIQVTASGRITAAAAGRIGRHMRRVASGRHRFGNAGAAHLTLRLSKTARARLRHHDLRLRITVTYSRGGLKKVAHVTLRRSSR